MICRWDHSEDLYVMRHSVKKIINKREIVVTIDTTDEEFVYLAGHVINEKNLFPAMGYLFLIWEMITLLNKEDYINVPVVFEDVNFIRATVLSQKNETEFILSIQRSNIIIRISNFCI